MDKINETIEHMIPVGSVIPYVSKTAPEGWLLCDKTSYPISKYPELAKVLGYDTTTGEGYFTVPDLRNKYLKGGSNGYQTNEGTLRTPWSIWWHADSSKIPEYGYGVTASEEGKIELPNTELNFIIKY